MALAKIAIKTLRKTVYEQLKESIITSEIPPGQIVSLRGLAEKLGVSPMPVREALLQLESEKVVVIDDNKKIKIKLLKPEDIIELFKIRTALEVLICESACDNRPESALPELHRLVDLLNEEYEDPLEYMKINYQFHFYIFKLADSPILLEMLDSIWTRLGPYIINAFDEDLLYTEAKPTHEKIVKALIEQDKKLIKKTITQGLKKVCDKVLSSLSEKKDV